MLLRCAGKPTRHRLKLDMNVRKTGAKDGIEGLALSEVVASPVVEGQPALKLIVASREGTAWE